MKLLLIAPGTHSLRGYRRSGTARQNGKRRCSALPARQIGRGTMKKTFASLAAVLILAGCATAPPGTPGAGSGATYTPVIDLQGVDQRRYSGDLESCRQYAYRIDPNRAAWQQGIGQAIFSAALMSAYGGRGRSIEQSANTGMLRGLNRGEGRALGTQERIITNCMAGRGYRTLDAAWVTPGAGSPYMNAPQAAEVAAPAAPVAAPVAAAVQLGTPVAAPIPAGAAVVQTAAIGTKAKEGGDSWSVEHMSEAKACHATPRAVLSAKGPGFESYAVGCANGDALLVRCEYGQCRVMR